MGNADKQERVHLPSLEAAGDLEVLLDALSRSGYLLEMRAARTIQSLRFTVLPNHVATADSDNEPGAEIDVVAYRDIPVGRRIRREGGEWPVMLRFLLLIECVRSPRPLVLFSRVHEERPLETPFVWSGEEYRQDAMGEVIAIEPRIWDAMQQRPGVRLEQQFFATQYCAFEANKGDEYLVDEMKAAKRAHADSESGEAKSELNRLRNRLRDRRWTASQSDHARKPIESLCRVMEKRERLWPTFEGYVYYALPILLTERTNVLMQFDPSGALCYDETDFHTLLWTPRQAVGSAEATRIQVVSEAGLPRQIAWLDQVSKYLVEGVHTWLDKHELA